MYKFQYIVLIFAISSCGPIPRVTAWYNSNQKMEEEWLRNEESNEVLYKVRYHKNGNPARKIHFAQGSKHGKYVEWYSNGNLKVAGGYHFGNLDGSWKWYNRTENLDSLITYNQGQFDGKIINYYSNGEIKFRKTFENGQKNGLYEIRSESGISLIKGTYENNLKKGKWIWKSSTGNLDSIRTYLIDKLDGDWKNYNSSGDIFEQRKYKNGMLHGKYITWNEIGDKTIIGEYLGGKREGEWVWKSDGENIDSMKTYQNDLYNGLVEYYEPSTHRLTHSIEFLNHKKHGIEHLFNTGGIETHTYHYINGLKNGEFILRYDDGSIEESGQYINGLYSGLVKRWYHTGALSSEIYYSNSVIHGTKRQYSPSGNLTDESYYSNGRLLYQFLYSSTKHLKRVIIYNDSAIVYENRWSADGIDLTEDKYITGTFKQDSYYPSGNLLTENRYKDGKLYGLCRSFYDDRSMKEIKLYMDGEVLLSRVWKSGKDKSDDKIYVNNEVVAEIIPEMESENSILSMFKR